MSGVCTLDGFTLPPDIEWEDEGKWLPVGVLDTVTVTGAVIRQGSAQQAGRPITLIARGDQHVWLTKADCDSLRALAAANVGTPMTLTLVDGRTFPVWWNHKDGAVEFAPVDGTYVVDPDAAVMAARVYTLTLRFLQA